MSVKSYREIERKWEEYCSISDCEIAETVNLSYNPTETKYKVEISANGSSINLTLDEFEALVHAGPAFLA